MRFRRCLPSNDTPHLALGPACLSAPPSLSLTPRLPLPLSLPRRRAPNKQCILDLLAVRKRANLDCRAKVTVRKAAGDVYAATINDKIAIKIGRGDWSPNSARIDSVTWAKACSGHNWACWEVAA